MKIECNDLLNLLRRAHIGAFGASSSGAPSQRKYAFTKRGLGGSCGSMSVMVPLEGWDGEDVAVDGVILEKSLKDLSGTLDITYTTAFTIKSGRATKIKLTPKPYEAEYYPIPGESLHWVKAPEGLAEQIRASAFTNNSAYEGVACAPIGDKKLLISTNTSRIYYKELPSDVPAFWLTTASAIGVGTAGTEITEMAADDLWVHFRYADGTIYSTLSKNVEKYPADELYAYTQSCNNGEELANGAFPEKALEAIRAAAVFAEGTNGQKPVKMTYDDKVLSIEASNKAGEYIQEVEWPEGPVNPFGVAVDAVFMNATKASTFRLVSIPDLSVMQVPGIVNALLALDNV